MITDDAKLIKALAYAEHVERTIKRVHIKQQEVDSLRGERALIGSPSLSGRVDVSPSADAIPNAVAHLIDLIHDYTTDLVTMVDEIGDFNGCLNRLEPAHHECLHLHYVALMPFKLVADKMGYNERYIYDIRDHGLIALYDVMPEHWRSYAIPNANI